MRQLHSQCMLNHSSSKSAMHFLLSRLVNNHMGMRHNSSKRNSHSAHSACRPTFASSDRITCDLYNTIAILSTHKLFILPRSLFCRSQFACTHDAVHTVFLRLSSLHTHKPVLGVADISRQTDCPTVRRHSLIHLALIQVVLGQVDVRQLALRINGQHLLRQLQTLLRILLHVRSDDGFIQVRQWQLRIQLNGAVKTRHSLVDTL